MDGPQDENGGLIVDMSVRELCEAASDPDVRLGGAAIASMCAAAGASLLAGLEKGGPECAEGSFRGKAYALAEELESMASRLDAAAELIGSFEGEVPHHALSAGIDASLSLLEACYFGQSLARLAANAADRASVLDLGTASMLLDAAAGSALLSATGYLSSLKDQEAVRKAEELIWAITHDRIGLKKQVLDAADRLIRGL